MTRVNAIKIIVAVVISSVLFAVYREFEPLWIRVAIAACAGGALGWALVLARKGQG